MSDRLVEILAVQEDFVCLDNIYCTVIQRLLAWEGRNPIPYSLSPAGSTGASLRLSLHVCTPQPQAELHLGLSVTMDPITFQQPITGRRGPSNERRSSEVAWSLSCQMEKGGGEAGELANSSLWASEETWNRGGPSRPHSGPPPDHGVSLEDGDDMLDTVFIEL